MRRLLRPHTLSIIALLAALAWPAAAGAAPTLDIGLEQNGGMGGEPDRSLFLDRERELGARTLRYILRFDHVARCDPGATGTLPDSPCYDFSVPDAVVAGAAARGMQVLLSVYGVPDWRSGGKGQTWTGSTDAQFTQFAALYADFMQAAATRYDGRHGHARVQRWTIWNEPNGQFWNPLRDDAGRAIGPQRYARLYDAAARRIKAVDPTFTVAIGPTAPIAPPFPPMEWTRIALPELQRLGAPIDAWAHNGYMSTQAAFTTTIDEPYVGLGNVDDLIGLLDTYSVTKGAPLWITEFGYQTAPSVQPAVTPARQAELLREAVYFAWLHPRIRTLIWYSLVDDDRAQNPLGFQSGLFFAGVGCASLSCPKPAAAAFSRPLWVSQPSGGKVVLWGRSMVEPTRTRIRVWQRGGGWTDYRTVASVSTGAVHVTVPATGALRAAVCDTSCGPASAILAKATAANDPRAMRVQRSPTRAVGTASKLRVSLKAARKTGWSVPVDCPTCSGTGTVMLANAKPAKAIAAGKVYATKSGRAVRFRLTAYGRARLANAARATAQLTLTLRAKNGDQFRITRSVTLS